MPTITDSFGVWNQLGTITPDPLTWIKFPNQATDIYASTFRATFSVSDPSLWGQINSFIWIRQVYSIDGKTIVLPSNRLYPKQESMLMELVTPEDFRQRDINFFYIEVKKRVYTRLHKLITDADYSLKIEELQG